LGGTLSGVSLTTQVSGTLPVANGGTGVTTSTGTSKTVLSSLPSFDTTIGVGAASASASGSGITFPATQSASTNVNTLDDYEEGTWTPTDASGNGLTFSSVSAYYTKIGDMVFTTFSLTFPGTTGSFINTIGSLPFTSAAGTAMNGFHVAYTNYSPGLMSPIDASATTFTLYDTTSGAGVNNIVLAGKLIRGTCIYKVT
jgi:hypothetical protein